mgnify:CR=1 FL=1
MVTRLLAVLELLLAGALFVLAYRFSNGLLYLAGGLAVLSSGLLLCMPKGPS